MKEFWTLLVLLATYILIFIDRASFLRLLINIQHELHLTHVQTGVLAGASSIMFGLSSVPVAIVISFYMLGRRKILFVSVVLFAIFSFFSSVPYFVSILVFRLLLGVFSSVLPLCAIGIINDMFVTDRFVMGRAYIYAVAQFASISWSFFFGFWIIDAKSLSIFGVSVHPWQLFFACLGIFTLLFSFLLLTISEPKTTDNSAFSFPGFAVIFNGFKARKRFLVFFFVSGMLYDVVSSSWSTFLLFFFQNVVKMPGQHLSLFQTIFSHIITAQNASIILWVLGKHILCSFVFMFTF